MQELITRLKVDIAREIKYGYPLDKRSWGDEDGLLITVNEASQIVALYEREQKQSKKESNCNLPQVSGSVCGECGGTGKIKFPDGEELDCQNTKHSDPCLNCKAGLDACKYCFNC